jgi:hypothetical protein
MPNDLAFPAKLPEARQKNDQNISFENLDSGLAFSIETNRFR